MHYAPYTLFSRENLNGNRSRVQPSKRLSKRSVMQHSLSTRMSRQLQPASGTAVVPASISWLMANGNHYIGGIKLLCDTARGRSRPFVPAPWRKKVFDAIHGLAHLGKKPTLCRAISSEFVCPYMHKDINNWCKLCLDCHQSKVSQHTRIPLQDFKEPSCHLDHFHVDIVGPLTPSQGFTYLFTIIDRFTRWTIDKRA